MNTQDIWHDYREELYFFILKKVKDKNAANDIFQNAFFKIHKNLSKLKNAEKAKAWIFQITRNEIANYFNQESLYAETFERNQEIPIENYSEVCCFDKFIDDLPGKYKRTIELVYLKGKKQKEAAKILEISLANVKARIRRAKEMLKERFNECCKYEFDKNGNLAGESDCPTCQF